MRRVALSVGCLLSILVGVEVVRAQPPKACSADIAKLCKGVEPGGGRLIACLKEHDKDVSKGCKDAIEQARQAFLKDHAGLGAALAACEADRQAHCKDVPMGGGRIRACLKKNEASLSDGCKAALSGKKTD